MLTSDRLPADYSRFHGPVLSPEEGHAAVISRLATDTPYLLGRIGETEYECVMEYLFLRSRGRPYTARNQRRICENSGVFSNDTENLDRFSQCYLDSLRSADLVGTWGGILPYEHELYREYCPQAATGTFDCTNPVVGLKTPWSYGLRGKRVLVVNAFVETIRSQYARREKLFDNPRQLPAFDLLTLKSVQTLGGDSAGFANWCDALESMKSQIAALAFDVALIGAGAYGLPLAAFVKSLGKQALVTGGVTQLLFGIRGKRWDNNGFAELFYNEHWVYPSDAEKPKAISRVDGYWK